MPDSLMFVQFPHPGAEHRPAGEWMDWNRGDHARKFLKARGTYLSSGTPRSGEFTFWGEWEPQSRVVTTFPKRGPAYPRWLQEPFWAVPRHPRPRQNTDPLVFGDQFMYSNCRQGRNRNLRRLAPGSIVVFGSKRLGEFVLDTVFVIGDESELFSTKSVEQVRCNEWVRATVFGPLATDAGSPLEEFRLYRGAMYRDVPSGPFSFVPSRPLGEGRFPRPAVRLPSRWISPNLAMGAKATEATAGELRHLWEEVVEQVSLSGLDLGVALEPPSHLSAKDMLPAR